MSKHDRKMGPSSTPPAAPELEANWDDETTPGLVLDELLNEFDRVTAIPDLPTELYVKQAMATAEDSRAPDPEGGHESAGAAVLAHDAPTARPLPAELSTPSPRIAPHSATFRGLALMELDSLTPVAPETLREPDTSARDSLEPELPLPFEGSTREPRTKTDDASPWSEMKDRYAMGDFSGALVIAEGIVESNPEDLEAPRYAQSCRDVLTQMYSARLGSLEQTVTVAVPSDQVRWLTLDHRAGFLLSLIDGGSTVDQILDISGMTRLDALRIMYQLLDQRVISIGS